MCSRKGLDAGTAFEILSIDVADVTVGENIGAKLQIDQANADKQIAQAKAEERRAMAVALEQEMRARVVEAEAEVPRAMAEAFRQGNLGIMDYYRMKNLQADTTMREEIAGADRRAPGHPTELGRTTMKDLPPELLYVLMFLAIVLFQYLMKRYGPQAPQEPAWDEHACRKSPRTRWRRRPGGVCGIRRGRRHFRSKRCARGRAGATALFPELADGHPARGAERGGRRDDTRTLPRFRTPRCPAMKLFSPLYRRAMVWSRHPHAPWYLGGMSFAESSFFPVPPDVMLALGLLAYR